MHTIQTRNGKGKVFMESISRYFPRNCQHLMLTVPWNVMANRHVIPLYTWTVDKSVCSARRER